MPPRITRYLNKTVFVAIPALFEDGVCQPLTLLGAELHGLWLQSDELTRRLLPQDKLDLAATVLAAVFVPFAQTAGVLVATGLQRISSSRKVRRPTWPQAAEPGRGPRRRAAALQRGSGSSLGKRCCNSRARTGLIGREV
jgi:hypothetical protein